MMSATVDMVLLTLSVEKNRIHVQIRWQFEKGSRLREAD